MAERPPEITYETNEWIERAAAQVARLIESLGVIAPHSHADFRLSLVYEDGLGGRVSITNDENDTSELLDRKRP